MGSRTPPELSEAWLLDQARRHLQRYRPTVEQMRRVLGRRVRRSLDHHGGDEGMAEWMVERVLAQLQQENLLDDARVAQAWTEHLRQHGSSRTTVQGKLRAKGVSREHIEHALAAVDGAPADPELLSAVHYVRRRRLGPLREPTERRERRDKDLAAVARAGFSYDVARRVIECLDLDALQAEAEGLDG